MSRKTRWMIVCGLVAAALLGAGVALWLRNKFVPTVLTIDLSSSNPLILSAQAGSKVMWKGPDVQDVHAVYAGPDHPYGPCTKPIAKDDHGFWICDSQSGLNGGGPFFYLIKGISTDAAPGGRTVAVPMTFWPCPKCKGQGSALVGGAGNSLLTVNQPPAQQIPLECDHSSAKTVSEPPAWEVTPGQNYTWAPNFSWGPDWTVQFPNAAASPCGKAVLKQDDPYCVISAAATPKTYSYSVSMTGCATGYSSVVIVPAAPSTPAARPK